MDIFHRASHGFTIRDQTLSVNVNFGAFNTHACIRVSAIDADQRDREVIITPIASARINWSTTKSRRST
jgi:hypothetical protein